MTGFGAASVEARGATVGVEIRSVNHRHLHVKTRLPSELSAVESEIEGLVRKKLQRGSVTLHASLTTPAASRAATLRTDVAKRYQKEVRRLASELGVEPTVTLEQLLALPGVVAEAEAEREPQSLQKPLRKAVDGALEALLVMRQTEGDALLADLRRHAKGLAGIVARMDKRMPKVVRTHQENLRRRVRELLDGAAVSETDLAREIALIADKGDVAEEVARIGSHLEQFEGLLAKGGAVGRQLDFLVQELFREVNTVGSKCSDATVAHWVVDAKTRIERLREQIQNVE